MHELYELLQRVAKRKTKQKWKKLWDQHRASGAAQIQMRFFTHILSLHFPTFFSTHFPANYVAGLVTDGVWSYFWFVQCLQKYL